MFLPCRGSVAAFVSETETTNATSGCVTYTLDITAQAEDCQAPQLPGVDPGCEASCAVVGGAALLVMLQHLCVMVALQAEHLDAQHRILHALKS